MAKQLRHDRHTVSLLTDHMVFSPKYRGKVLVGQIRNRKAEIYYTGLGLKSGV